MPFPLIPAIAAGTSLLNNIFQSSTNTSNQRFAVQQAQQQRQWALEDWDKQNAYNSPVAQMTRFKQAGLNPNLIYGQTNTAAPVRSTEQAKFQKVAPQIDNGAIMGAIGAMYDLQKTVAQTDNLKAQGDLIRQQTDLARLNAANRGFDLRYKNDSLDFNLENIQNKNRLLTKQAYKADADRTYTEDQNIRSWINTNQTVKMNVEKILTMQMDRSKSVVQKQLMQQQINSLSTDQSIKAAQWQWESELHKNGLDKNSPTAFKLLQKIVSDVTKSLSSGSLSPIGQ